MRLRWAERCVTRKLRRQQNSRSSVAALTAAAVIEAHVPRDLGNASSLPHRPCRHLRQVRSLHPMVGVRRIDVLAFFRRVRGPRRPTGEPTGVRDRGVAGSPLFTITTRAS